MTVYLVMKATGSWEDYYREVFRIFTSPQKAEECIAEQKVIWANAKMKSDKCQRCIFNWEIENVKSRDKFMSNALKHCADAQFDWEHKSMPCNSIIWNDDTPSWKIEEHEID